jgi:dTDP-glucose 4,6-dehydratase/UDP-glucuronate decarboxylase
MQLPFYSLITGGAGFLGSHLADRLIAAGHEVVIMDNLSSGSVTNIGAAISSGKASYIFGDCAQDVDTLRGHLAAAKVPRLDRIFHLASPASPEAYGNHPWETLLVNSLGTMSLIEIALEHRARFIYSSTSEIYGDPLVHPQPETYFGNVDPIGPRSCYDEAKRFGEAAVAAAVSARGLDARIVRFFNCYGPRMQRGDGRLIPALIDAALAGRPLPIHGTGRQTRSMTFVSDALELLLLVTESKQEKLQPVNIGNDDERSIEEIASAFAKVLGAPFKAEYLDARPGDPQRRRPDMTLARSLGWLPATELESGLAQTLVWFSEARLAYA